MNVSLLDSGDLPFFLFVMVGAVIGMFVYRRYRLGVSRKIHAEATRRGDWYAHNVDFTGDLPGDPFGRGDDWEGNDIIFHIRDGLLATTFEYQWTVTTGSGKSRRRTTYRRKITGIWIGGLLPPLDVHEEANWTWSPGDFATESIEFNDKYRVFSHDTASTLAILHPRMMEYLLARREQVGGFAIGSGWLFTAYADYDLYTAHDLAYPYLRDVLAGIPEWLANDYRINPAIRPDDWETAVTIMERLFAGLPSTPTGVPALFGPFSDLPVLSRLSRL